MCVYVSIRGRRRREIFEAKGKSWPEKSSVLIYSIMYFLVYAFRKIARVKSKILYIYFDSTTKENFPS